MLESSSRPLRRAALLGAALIATALASPAGALEPSMNPAPPAEPPEALPQLSNVPRTVEDAGAEPRGDFPPPPPTDPARTLSAAVSVGPGWLALRDSIGREGQGARAFGLRFGAVIAAEWNVFLGIERTSTERGGATFAQSAAIVGAQRFLFGRLYAGAGLGMAFVQETGVPRGLTDGPAPALSGTLGVEVVRTLHCALTIEVTMTAAQYPKEAWEMGGVRLGVVLF
jgi:hypothetical protein